jgi:hypothetical protein
MPARAAPATASPMLSVGHAVTCRHPPWGMPATAQRAGCGTATVQAVQVHYSLCERVVAILQRVM